MFYSNLLNSKMLDLIEAEGGSGAHLKIYGGTVPANADTALTGQALLVDITIPGAADWMLAATVARPSVAAKQAATWSATAGAPASSGVLATFFRITNSAGTTTVLQGTVGQGAGELSLDNATIAQNQVVSIPTTFAISSAN
jgi:hypothetical protein